MNNNTIFKQPLSLFLLLFALLVSGGACKKKDDAVMQPDASNLGRVVADNFNLSVFNTGLKRSGLNNKLLETGPFTIIAPSDDAFNVAGYPNSAALLAAEPAKVSALMQYHILDGNYDFKRLPFLFNQEIRSYNGGKLFVTHWVKGPDTILTINGAVILAKNIPASNGVIQVIDRVLQPYAFTYVLEAIANDRNLSLFYQALQKAGLTELLSKNETYTVFAPDNAAMRAYGLSSLQAIEATDQAELNRLMRYHILADRRFVYDYVLSTGASLESKQTMLDGNSVIVGLLENPSIPGAYNGISVQGIGNTFPVYLTSQDVLAGNGVLHTIDNMLKVTQ